MSKTAIEQKTIAEWRRHLGYSVHEFAELAGMNSTTLHRIEIGLVSIKTRSGARVLRVLEDLGVKREQVDVEAAVHRTRREIEARARWNEDGLRRTVQPRPLREWRHLRGISQEDLTILSGLSLATVSMVENGNRGNVLETTRLKLADALRVRPDKIILPGEEVLGERERTVDEFLRAELRGARRTLRQAYDFLREDPNIAFKALDKRDAVLSDVEREIRGT